MGLYALLIPLLLLLPHILPAMAQQPPTSQPLLHAANLTYAGTAWFPAGGNQGGFTYGGSQITYDANAQRFYATGHDNFQLIGAFPLPQFLSIPSINEWPQLQAVRVGFASGGNTIDPSAGRMAAGMGAGWRVGGLLIKGNELYVSTYTYYDPESLSPFSHWKGTLPLTAKNVQGGYRLTNPPGYTGGPMTRIPAEWQPLFGGNALTGLMGVPVICRSSLGPTATVIQLSDLGTVANPVPSTTVLRYPCDHPTLGTWSQNPPTQWWSGPDFITGIQWVQGTRTIVYFGQHGATNCYGDGTENPALHGVLNPATGQLWCYDPGVPGRQNHGYPYTWRFWFYDANDLLAAKNGQRQIWETLPYEVVDFSIPVWGTGSQGKNPGGMAYDVTTQSLFITQRCTVGDCEPILHRYNVTIPTAEHVVPTNLRLVEIP